MHHPKVALLASLLLPLLAALFLRAAVAKAAPAQSCAWHALPAPNPSGNDQLNAIAATSATSAWIVGSYYTSSNDVQTLIEHWNGTQWSIVTSPNATEYDELNAVTALSATDAWAVGVAYSSTNATPLTEHWNGTQWSIVSTPSLGNGNGSLDGVSAVASNDVWAVGGQLILHWNGTSWQLVKSPPPPAGDYYQLKAVAAVSASSVWAVGELDSSQGFGTWIEHWNGTSWSVVTSPTLSSRYLQAVAASSANDVWAVGGSSAQTLIEHWNGTRWSVVASPTSGELEGVAVFSATDAWTVGWYGDFKTLTEHWNGTSWSVVTSPNPGAYDRLSGVAVVPGSNQVWAEGIQVAPTGNYQTLTELYC